MNIAEPFDPLFLDFERQLSPNTRFRRIEAREVDGTMLDAVIRIFESACDEAPSRDRLCFYFVRSEPSRRELHLLCSRFECARTRAVEQIARALQEIAEILAPGSDGRIEYLGFDRMELHVVFDELGDAIGEELKHLGEEGCGGNADRCRIVAVR